MIVDVHAHLDFDEYQEGLEELLIDQKKKGVSTVVVNGVGPSSNRKIKELAQRYPLIKPAYGYYPVHVAEDGLEAVKKELAWIEKEKPIALGEVGLDYKHGDDNPHGDLHKDVQQEAFRLIVLLAQKLNIPLIIHSRKAESDVLDILEEMKAKKVVLHCFMGKKRVIERARNLGYTFSVPVIVVKLEQTQWLVENVPLKQLLTETDSPYLGPEPGVRNEPANCALSIAKIAEIKGLDEKEVKTHLYLNYQKLFL